MSASPAASGARPGGRFRRRWCLALALALTVAAACSPSSSDIVFDSVPPDAPGQTGQTGQTDTDETGTSEPRAPVATGNQVIVRTDEVVATVDPFILGTNVPAWLFPDLLAAEGFVAATVASGVTMLRLPGGSWSNHYDWLACELGDEERCHWTWASRPSDFLALLTATGLPGMWTASINGTAEEAAAAVAFFNGDVDDERVIGVDRGGRDWGTVGQWAQLRADRGFPDPAPIVYWEVGNEVYGALSSVGPACAPWGWEDIWTCDAAEYVNGTDDHDGFLQFREAMLAVDPDIEVGVVGVGDRGSWGDWDDVVMATAGEAIDFYIVHHYGSDGDVPAGDVLDVPRRHWPRIVGDILDGYTAHGIADDVPIAVTEHNLVSFIDADDDRLMTTALNAFYLADTIGQFAANGVSIANQWNLANGRAENGSDYGLIDGETHERTPAYYTMVLWSRFGDELVEVELGSDSALDDLLLYGGRAADGSARLLVTNPGPDAVSTSILLEPVAETGVVTADVVVAESPLSSTVTFNGSTEPSVDLTEPSPVRILVDDGVVDHEFPAYSMTLLRWDDEP